MRQFILNPKNYEETEISIYPLSVTYLETTGGAKEYTSNWVGFTKHINPYLIFMNDFVIQFFDSSDNIKFNELHGLNNLENYQNFINIQEERFVVPVVHNGDRKTFFQDFIAEKVKRRYQSYADIFQECWFFFFRIYAT